MEPWQRELLISSWAIWSVAMILVICRFLSRRMALGSFRRYQVDDWLMVLCAASYTGVVVTSNEVAVNGSNYIPEGEELTWTEEQYRQAEWGSKMLIAFEEFTLGTLWLVKTCLLILYYRMT